MIGRDTLQEFPNRSPWHELPQEVERELGLTFHPTAEAYERLGAREFRLQGPCRRRLVDEPMSRNCAKLKSA
jgi:hypothetical protein